MEPVIIQQKTGKTPGIVFTPDDEILKIEGRSIPENPELVYRSMREWMVKYFTTAQALNVRIMLEYINSGSSKHLLEVLRLIKEYKEGGKDVKMVWYYEEDDESIMELGEHYRDTSGIPIDIEMMLP